MFTKDEINFSHEPVVIYDAELAGEQFGREPVLRRMKDGSLICVIFSGGSHEPQIDNYVMLTRSEDDGMTWSKPEIIFKHPTRACWGTEIFTEAGGDPCMFVHTYTTDSKADSYVEIKAFNIFSEDNGKTWSKPVNVAGFPANISVRRGIVLNNGTWLFPIYWVTQHKSRFCCGVMRSENQGESYSIHGYLKIDGVLWEPTVAEIEPNHIVMYMRAESKNELYFSESYDGGLTWTDAAPSGIPNPGSKVTLMKIKDTVVMLNSSCRDTRKLIDLKTSLDGRTWTDKFILAEETREPQKHFVCYPDGFPDDEKQVLYVAIDSGVARSRKKFYMMKIPYSDFL